MKKGDRDFNSNSEDTGNIESLESEENVAVVVWDLKVLEPEFPSKPFSGLHEAQAHKGR